MRCALPFILFLGLLVPLPSRANHLSACFRSETSSQRSGQNQLGQSSEDRAVLHLEALSPYLIEWYIDLNEDADLAPIWHLLKLEAPDKGSYKCDGTCSAETFALQMDSEGRGDTIALQISFKKGDFYQYLLFRKVKTAAPKEEWRFIGNVDSRGQRYAPPQYRIESGDNRTWFVLRELWGAGSGSRVAGESWYEIKESGLKRVLSYPVEGHQMLCQHYLGRSYKSVLLRHELDNGVYTVPVQFLVTYNLSECGRGNHPLALFGKGQKVYYVWDGKKEQFVLDASRSEITENQIRSLYSLGDFSKDAFLEDNYQELYDLAKMGSKEQIEWLKQFLNALPDSSRKIALLNLLLH